MRYSALPTYSTLLRHYPDKHSVPTKQLLDSIGGQVRKQLDDSINTCATRISQALNESGQPIRRIYDATKEPRDLVNLPAQTQGIVVFVWSGPYSQFAPSDTSTSFDCGPTINGRRALSLHARVSAIGGRSAAR